MYLNGKILAITFRNLGKKTIGIVNPENISIMTVNKAIIPFSSSVNIAIQWYSIATAVINKLDISSAIRNKIKLTIFIGGNSLYGFGKITAIIIMGKNLIVTAANLLPYMVAYHFL